MPSRGFMRALYRLLVLQLYTRARSRVIRTRNAHSCANTRPTRHPEATFFIRALGGSAIFPVRKLDSEFNRARARAHNLVVLSREENFPEGRSNSGDSRSGTVCAIISKIVAHPLPPLVQIADLDFGSRRDGLYLTIPPGEEGQSHKQRRARLAINGFSADGIESAAWDFKD